jgi:hypothetical protein
MHRTRRALVAGAAGLALTFGAVAVASPASADTGKCVTKAEFREVQKGMKKLRVRRIFDIRGESAGHRSRVYTRFYGSCEARRIGGGDGGAYVKYKRATNRVVGKRWIGYV